MELASIIIPSFNHERYIESAIESVLHQDWPNIELVIIDDGSSDKSPMKIQAYRDRRIIFESQRNAGAHVAINRGIARSTGDIIAILNSDDVFERERLSTIIDAMDAAGSEFGCSWIRNIDARGGDRGIKQGWASGLPSWAADIGEYEVSDDELFAYNLLRTNFISTTSNMVFTRGLFERVGGFRNLRFAHDWDFALRAIQYTKGVTVTQPLLRYRTHGANTISSNREWMLFEVCWVLAANFDNVQGAVPSLTEDELQASHYGVRNPLYAILLERIRGLVARRSDPGGDKLLTNALQREKFLDGVKANLSMGDSAANVSGLLAAAGAASFWAVPSTV